MSPEEQSEMLMLQRLQQQVSGVDIYGNPLKNEEHRAAVEAYERLKTQRAQREAEKVRLQLEREKQAAEIEAEKARIQIEAEKVQVLKAEVFVRALEVAVKAGIESDHLLTVLQGFGDKLLPGASEPRLLGDSHDNGTKN